MEQNKKIHKSGEDYLEAILFIEKEKGIVKSIDVANHLKVTRPSVCRALDILDEKGYIVKETYGKITITPLGRKTAEKIAKKHFALTSLLHDILGVSEENAESDACKIEHDISEETSNKIIDFLKSNPKNQ